MESPAGIGWVRLTLKVINVFWSSACVEVGVISDDAVGEVVKLQPTNKVRMINVDVNQWKGLRGGLSIEDDSTHELEWIECFYLLNALLILSSGIEIRDYLNLYKSVEKISSLLERIGCLVR